MTYLVEQEQLKQCLFDFLCNFSSFDLDSDDLDQGQGHSHDVGKCVSSGSKLLLTRLFQRMQLYSYRRCQGNLEFIELHVYLFL